MSEQQHCSCVYRMNLQTPREYDFAMLWFGDIGLPLQYTQHLTKVQCVECGQNFFVGNLRQLFIASNEVGATE